MRSILIRFFLAAIGLALSALFITPAENVFAQTDPEIEVTKTANPTQVVEPGGNVTFTIEIENLGEEVNIASIVDDVFGDVADDTNPMLISTTCSVPFFIFENNTESCQFVANVTGTAGSTHTNTVTVSGAGTSTEPGIPVSDTASAEVEITLPPPTTGNIIVVKETDPDGDLTEFSFTPSYDLPFTLSDGESNDSGPLTPGTYSVSESVPSGWTLTSATCDDGSDPGNIDLVAGETITCTFLNTEDPPEPGTIIVEKITVPPGDSTEFTFTPSYGAPFTLSDGQSNNSGPLTPGTYSVVETVPADWMLADAFCDDGSDPDNIGLDAGETVTCTFVNSKVTVPEITVTKTADPTSLPEPGGDVTFTVLIENTGEEDVRITSLTDNIFGDITQVAGDISATTCAFDQPDNIEIYLDIDEIYQCEFTAAVTGNEGDTHINTVTASGLGTSTEPGIPISDSDDATVEITGDTPSTGNIIVVKQTDPAGDTTEFTFDPNYGVDFTLSDGESNDSGPLAAGTYSVVETVPSGWTLTSATCDDGSDPTNIDLAAGETVTCTFLNTQDVIVLPSVCPTGVGDFRLTQIVGNGMYKPKAKTNQSNVTLVNPQDLIEVYAQLAGKRYGVPKKVVFQSKNGKQLVDKVVFNNKFPTSPGYRAAAVYWYGAELDPAAKITVRSNETFKKGEATPRAFIVYPTYSTMEEYFNHFEVLESSIANHVYWGPSFISEQTHVVQIPALLGPVTINASIALVDNDPDGRPIYLTVSAGGVTQFFAPDNPSHGKMLNIIDVVLTNVPAGTDEVVFHLLSPGPNSEFPDGGDSVAMVGLTVNYPCVSP